jgi:hypothetical protein
MFLLSHCDLEAASQSALELKAMGANAVKLLEECVAEQTIERSKLSVAAKMLDNAGFIRINDSDQSITARYTFSSTLTGEEALEYYHENMVTIRLG